MSAGHSCEGGNCQSRVVVDRLLKNPDIVRLLYRPKQINNEYDLPYLGGYSKDGETIYIDRHLPESIMLEDDGNKKELHPYQFIADHERFEKAVMDVLGWSYEHAHQAATGYERRHVLEHGFFWKQYDKCLQKYIKSDEHEKLTKVPSNLDMRPYYAPPVDRGLIARMEKVMGTDQGKVPKKDVDYSKGMPSSHCGPVHGWPHKGECEHFIHPYGCEKVKGYIEPKYWCKLWASK